jgi:hypothetical protein
MRDWPVAPNPPFQLTPLRVEQDRGFSTAGISPSAFPVYGCGAGEAQSVGLHTISAASREGSDVRNQ